MIMIIISVCFYYFSYINIIIITYFAFNCRDVHVFVALKPTSDTLGRTTSQLLGSYTRLAFSLNCSRARPKSVIRDQEHANGMQTGSRR